MRRRGYNLLEVTSAGVLLLALMVVSLKFFSAATHQRQSVAAKQVAAQEAANVMERLSLWTWDDLTAENTAALKPSAEACRSLDDVRIEVKVEPADEPVAKKVAVEVRWQPSTDEPQRAVRLVAWRYKNKP